MTNTTRELWRRLGGAPAACEAITISGPSSVLCSKLDVTRFAADAVAVATLGIAEVLAARSGRPLEGVEVDTIDACAAFRSEALFEPIGWERPAVWDPIAGDYRALDRWIRLHTNYTNHRAAVLRVLGTTADRAEVAAAVARLPAATIETAVIEEGGCAAVMYRPDEWRAHPHGAATAREPAITTGEAPAPAPALPGLRGALPLGGIRVLDLTRVLAGPVCTRFLAAHGAEVLRLDPPGFAEVQAIVPDVTVGKRCAFLALGTPEGNARFAELVARADVIVHGFRPGALASLGFGDEVFRKQIPAIVIATHDAYGWTGPWRGRRGFDSLLQMSTGIAAEPGLEKPSPLPAQALDHGLGYLLAAGVARALAQRARGAGVFGVRGSLVGVANHLLAGPRAMGPTEGGETPPWPAHVFEETSTAWGPARRVRCPGGIGGVRPTWSRPAGPLGADVPAFTG